MFFRFVILVCVLLGSASGFAQICDNRAGTPMQMQVQLAFADQPASATTVVPHDDSNRGEAAANSQGTFDPTMQISVQLQDPLGGTLQEALPNADGLVRLTVCRKTIYRLRVIGATIQESVVDDVQPGRGDRIVTISLHRKLSKEEQKAPKATISAHSLNVPKKAKKQLAAGDDALKKGKLADAEKHYRNAIAIDPQFEEAENNLGIVLMQQGNRTDGQAAFERALAANHSYAPAQVNLAKIAFDEKRYDDSYTLVRQSLRSEPLNPGALFVAAESAFFTRQYAETVSYVRTLHSLPHDQYGLAHYLAGKSLEAQQQPAAAVAEYRMFVQEDPSDPNVGRAQESIVVLQETVSQGAEVPK